MERETELRTAGSSGHGAGVVGRTLYPLAPLRLVSPSAANEGQPFWMDADLAPIAVWWDYPPS
jgi:hypothetical protein